jgi:hypothetical protein
MIRSASAYAAVCPVCGEKCIDISQAHEAAVAHEPSFWQRLPEIFTYPFKKDGPIILIAGAIFFAIADFIARHAFFIGILVSLIITGYLLRYYFSVVSDSAEGKPSPPTWPELERGSYISESFDAIFKFIGPAALSFAPAAAYYFFGPKKPDLTLLYLLIAFGCVYCPMGLTAVAVFDDLGALNPIPIVRSMFRAPLEYLATCIIFAFLLLVNYLRQIYLVIPIFAIGPVIRWFILLYLWTVTMHLLGIVLLRQSPQASVVVRGAVQCPRKSRDSCSLLSAAASPAWSSSMRPSKGEIQPPKYSHTRQKRVVDIDMMVWYFARYLAGCRVARTSLVRGNVPDDP